MLTHQHAIQEAQIVINWSSLFDEANEPDPKTGSLNDFKFFETLWNVRSSGINDIAQHPREVGIFDQFRKVRKPLDDVSMGVSIK